MLAAEDLRREVQANLVFMDDPILIQLLHRFLASKEKTVRRRTYQNYVSKARLFIDYYKGGEFSHREAQIFLDYLIEERGLNKGTRNDFRVFMNMFFGYLLQRELWPENPFERTKKVRAVKQPARYFQPRQVRQLQQIFQEEQPILARFTRMMFYTFIRPAELRRLRVADILFDERKIYVPGQISKNGKSQEVVIPDPLWDDILTWDDCPPGYYLFGRKGGLPGPDLVGQNYFTLLHLSMLRKLGYPEEYKLYSWKHTGAVMALKAGINIKQLQIQLRHHSLDQVDSYLQQLGVSDLKDLVSKFPEI